jgi:hypothetical protein
MRVEPRTTSAQLRWPSLLVGMTLKQIRVAHKEMIVTFEGTEDAHLICTPEGQLITPPDGGQLVQITRMKYEIGTGPMTILAESQVLAGEATEILDRRVTHASHDPNNHVFGIQLGGEYGLIITPMGIKVLYTKELNVEFRKPLVVQ